VPLLRRAVSLDASSDLAAAYLRMAEEGRREGTEGTEKK
jgi:hypothetical protein